MGRWPWSRHHLAQLVNTLFEQHDIVVMGMDVVFAEPDDSSGLRQLERLAEEDLRNNSGFLAQLQALRAELDFDGRFAQALANRPVILGYYFTSDRTALRSGTLPAPVIDPALTGDRPFRATQWNGYGSNIERLASAAPRAGYFNPIIDADGIVRSLPLLAEHDGRYYESLSLAMFRHIMGEPAVRPGYAPGAPDTGVQRLKSIVLQEGERSMDIPVDDRLAALIQFRGRGGPTGGTYPYFSAVDVLQGLLPPGMLDGTVVLLGTTAPGLMDLRATPVSEVFPGVEIHANMLASLLDGRVPVRPDYTRGYEIVQVLTVGLLLATALVWLNALWGGVVTATTAVGLIALDFWLFSSHQLALPVVTAVLMVITMLVLHALYGYFVETRSKRQLADLFGSYVPPELVEEMVKEPERYSMQAQSRVLTVMFTDMRGFTTLSEKLEPEDLQRLLNRLFSRLTTVIRQHGGTIDKFMGDCIMAFWGAPIDTPDHARKAVKAALDMGKIINTINAEHAAEGLPPIGMGVGINTGPMLVGDMGSDLRRSYTVIGDAVNLGSRLEGLGKTYGVDVVVSETTRQQAGSDWTWQELDKVKVKGKDTSVTIYTPWPNPLQPPALQALATWERFLQSYRAQTWDEAQAQLAVFMATDNNPVLCALYQERIQAWKEQPPPSDWDGSFRFDSK
ncbi:MAG: adenylate/guanylate cyclase domain-containing protein [Burkholderiaceae bacterium]|nr:adenylate/guanylate cyclase domain-containing protein [Burkholderiaceae bacterium]